MCEVNFLVTFREPLWVPKRLREIYLAHRAKSLKPELKKGEVAVIFKIRSSKSKVILILKS